MANIGDHVRYLNSVGGGTIVRIEGNIAYVDEDGFESPVMLRECVVVSPAATHVPPYGSNNNKNSAVPTSKETPASKEATKPSPKAEDTFVVEETPGGEKLNIVLGYEAADLKKLSTTKYNTYLVNDSNYYLYFTYLTSDKKGVDWTLRYDGIVEPGIQIHLGELTKEDIPEIERVAIQYIAFKRGKSFAMKQPACVNLKLDTTKFFKLHCFQPNVYFDQPVIALNITVDDVAQKQLEIKAEDIEKSLRKKIHDDNARPQPVKKHKREKDSPLVVDLHITELVDSTRGLSNADMLNKQVDTFCKVMDANLRNHGQKIVFIHGKGDGVLRKALMKELNYRYKGHDVQDASFQEYGYGATQVTIR